MSPLSPIPSFLPEFPMEPIPKKTDVTEKTIASPNQPAAKESQPDLSPDSQQVSTKQDQMNKLPEIRKDRIAKIQRAIENGTYSVSAEQLAKKIIQEL